MEVDRKRNVSVSENAEREMFSAWEIGAIDKLRVALKKPSPKKIIKKHKPAMIHLYSKCLGLFDMITHSF
jgi:hypothetical protein